MFCSLYSQKKLRIREEKDNRMLSASERKEGIANLDHGKEKLTGVVTASSPQ